MKKRLHKAGLSIIVSIAVFFAVSGLFSGCGESGLMDIYAASTGVGMSTIPAGSVLEPGENIPVRLTADSGSAPIETLGVRIYKGAAAPVFARDYELASSLVLVDTEGLSPGFYTLIAFSGNREKAETEMELPFFISSHAGSIQSISAYPSTVFPGEGMVLFADIAPGPSTDPYIRWKAAGRTIASGRVSDGAQFVNWQVPESPGIYPVTAEYFPFPPPENMDFSFSGTEQRSEAFVSTEQRTPSGELGPADVYSTLFHFRGSFDSGGNDPVQAPQVHGNPVLALKDEIFGYDFTEEDALIFDTCLIPLTSGESGGFVFEMKGIFSGNGSVFSVSDRQDVQILSLRRSDEGFLLSGGGSRIPLVLPRRYRLSEPDLPLYLAIVAEPGIPSGQLRWYVDGEYQGSAALPGISGLAGAGLSTVIGGGFSGLIDELGIRKLEPVPDGGIFGFAMRERYGRSLVMAEGFDLPWPADLLLEGSTGCSANDEERSVLIIERNGRAGFPFPVPGAESSVSISFKDSSIQAAVCFIQGEQESPSFSLLPEDDGSVILKLLRREQGTRISLGETVVASFAPGEDNDELQLWIEADYGSLGLDSILITRGEERFSSRMVETGRDS